MAELVDDYERGIHTFAEVVTAIVCEAATRDADELVRALPESFVQGVRESACSLPDTATADEVIIVKSSRAHAERWFRGAASLRRYFAEPLLRPLG